VPVLQPTNAKLGIEDLATKLKKYIATNLSKQDRFVLISFSMGCIISRYYLQILGGHNQCSMYHAISGPFNGTLTAYFYFSRGAKQMRFGSSLLQQLKQTESTLQNIPLYSYRTTLDQMIIPSNSSHWKLATNYVVNALFHRTILSNNKVFTLIEQSLASQN